MKHFSLRILFLFAVLAVATSVKAGNSTQELFDRGNALYTSNDFEGAVEAYKAILTSGYESSEVYYNLGNAFFKLRNYPKAIVNYERALLLNPANEDARHNLDKARIYLVDKIEAIPEFALRRFFYSLLSVFSSNTWALLSMTGFVLSIAALLVYFLSRRLNFRRSGFVSAVILLVIAGLAYSFSKNARDLQQHSGQAIIMSPTVTVKASPSPGGTDLFIIHEGIKVYFMEKIEDWYEIKLSDGKQGWILASEMEII